MTNYNQWLEGGNYKILVDRLQEGLFALVDGKVVYSNQFLSRLLGYEPQELQGRSFTDLVYPADLSLVQERYEARLQGLPVPVDYEVRALRSDGSWVDVLLSVGLSQGPDGEAITVGSVKDITEQKQAFALLAQSQQELKTILDQLPDVFYRTDMEGRIVMISPACFEAIGYRPEEMIGKPMADFYHDPEQRAKIAQAIVDGGGRAKQVEAALRHKSGRAIWVSTNAAVRLDPAGRPKWVEGVARDISQRKQMEDELLRLATTDDLTGLYNRRHFFGRAEQLITVVQRYQRPLSALMLDLDHFKKINDQFGHQAGDKVLQLFAGTCKQLVRDADLVGRLGGEEFGIVLPETSTESAHILAERIRSSVESARLEGSYEQVGVTVSIGLVGMQGNHDNLEQLLSQADMALYEAKAQGRNRVVVLN
ncbi:MAG: diguanylate cyclase [bacterium]|nr:diguanylate cyclase [bacterium]